MKLLVFAHKPPPHHGQSYMVQLLLDAMGGDVRQQGTVQSHSSFHGTGDSTVECYHVDARLSDSIDAIGHFQFRKLWLILHYCLKAIACRFRHGVRHFYYIPAPPLRSALYRDWIVMALCRPFFSRIIFHWHAVGLTEWLETQARPLERWISRLLLGRPSLSMVLAQYNRRDGERLASRRITVVPNGIPDPCPHYDSEVLPRRRVRASARRKLAQDEKLTEEEARQAGAAPEVFQVLYIGLCHREKGVFDLVEAMAIAHRQLRGSPLRMKLVVAGTFWIETDRVEFERRIQQPDLTEGGPAVDYRGFVSGTDKVKLFHESDCLCFPTYYQAESFGLVLVEAMAFGLPVVATRWRMVPELLPQDYPGLVEPRSPEQLANALLATLDRGYDESQRQRFLQHFTVERFAENVRAVLNEV